MNKRIRAFVGIFLLSALLLSGCSKNSTDEPAESDSSSGVSGGASSELSAEPVTFTGTDLEGNTVSSDLFSQSALTMVNVWATYCNPCLREMPALGELAEDYAPETFQIWRETTNPLWKSWYSRQAQLIPICF